MAFQLQVIDARNSGELRKVSGVAASSSQFLDLLNEVERRLIKRGGFYGLEQTMGFCIDSCYITWPKFVGTILGVRFRSGHHNRGALPYNNWWSFTNNWGAWGGHGYGSASGDTMMGYGHGHAPAVIEDAGTGCTYNDVTGTTGKYIVYHIVNGADVGKTITLYGRQYGNQPLQQTVGGMTQMGQTLVASTPADATTPNLITSIESVVRQPTSGMAYLYELDPATNLLHDLAVYWPHETNPRYRRSRILNHQAHFQNTTNPTNTPCSVSIEALVKLQFTPLVSDLDFLLIDDLDAIKLGMQAVKMEEKSDSQGAEIKWVEAIRELNMELRDKFPDVQTSARIHVTGRTLRNPI